MAETVQVHNFITRICEPTINLAEVFWTNFKMISLCIFCFTLANLKSYLENVYLLECYKYCTTSNALAALGQLTSI